MPGPVLSSIKQKVYNSYLVVCVSLQAESVDHTELSFGPESEKTVSSETITISQGGLWGATGWGD